MKKAYLTPTVMIGAGLTVLFAKVPVELWLGLLAVWVCYLLSLFILTSEKRFPGHGPPMEPRDTYIPLGLCYGVIICLQILTSVTKVSTSVVALAALLVLAGVGRVHHVIFQRTMGVIQIQNRRSRPMWRIPLGLTPLFACVILSSGRNVFLSSQFLTWVPVVAGIFVLLFVKRHHLPRGGLWESHLSERGVLAAGGLSATILSLPGLVQSGMSGPAAAGMLVCTFYTMVTAIWVRYQGPARRPSEDVAVSPTWTLAKAGAIMCLFPCLALGLVIQAL